ncbi:cytochrome [Xylanimonas oleitrophica]|uniref:Cytochrome n=1 Tax=Xylanimonas oleitrophica TaxID=2607479 RepID=A0A2W5WTD5_9MICO|nr:cytochrome P450 [Xylanimonas oleitrophica]PZR53853.1 cytochrome [Xylanimonas oleitrophica]
MEQPLTRSSDSAAQVPVASPVDVARAVANVLLPMAASGAIVRRPRVMALRQRLQLDARAVKEMQRLRERYGPGPVQVIPGRRISLVFEPQDVHRVLNGSPEPFTPASLEKRGALGHFQPAGVLVSSAEERAHRRPFNEKVLEQGRPVHHHGEKMAAAIAEEVEALLGHVEFTGTLTWDDFAVMWWRMVRRIVLGDSARDDERVTDDLLRLRKDANMSYLKPRRVLRRRRFLEGLQKYVDRAEPGSLAEMVATTPAHPDTQPVQQIPQWLFASDAAAWASFRALAMLSAYPDAGARAREEVPSAPDLPYLRSCVLESLRLWPTTPLILRDTTEDTRWENGTLPAGSSIVIFAPFFHRDETRVPEAHRFEPELWLRERTDEDWPFVPFSGGPAMCPGRNVALLMASNVLAHLVKDRRWTVSGAPPLGPERPVPASFSPFGLTFTPA